MVEMTYGKLHGVIANDNTNINNMIRGFVAESANAAVLAVYDDSLILVDSVNNDVYTCKYHYNPDTLSVIMEDFEKIDIVEDNSVDFKVAVKDYLISEESDSKALLNSYLKTLNKSKTAVESLVAEAVADKDYSNTADFEELSFINEEFEDLRKSDFFEAYQERLITHPLSNVLHFDWENPVAFTLYETCEPKTYINSKSKKKAKKLCASKDFKKKLCSACKAFSEDVEEGGDALLELFVDNLSLLSLNSTELKEAIAKSVMTDPEIGTNFKQISEAVIHFVNNDKNFQYLKEAIDIDDSEDDASSDEKKETDASSDEKKETDDSEKKDDKEEEDEDDKAVELTDEDKEKLVSALKYVVEKATDEKIKNMAQELLDKFDNDDDGTKPDDVKEAVRFLSI